MAASDAEMGAALPRLVVFAKRPIAGRVKTRLAATIGPEAALAAYVELLEGLLARLEGAGPWRLELAVTPDAASDEEDAWPRALPRFGQGDGDLGTRMGRVLAQAQVGAPVLIVGSDVPALGAADVMAAFAALNRADIVLGPAPDGGYWCIGASRPPPGRLFGGVRWSTAHARADTLANATGLRVEVLKTELEDVDDEASWRRWRAGA